MTSFTRCIRSLNFLPATCDSSSNSVSAFFPGRQAGGKVGNIPQPRSGVLRFATALLARDERPGRSPEPASAGATLPHETIRRFRLLPSRRSRPVILFEALISEVGISPLQPAASKCDNLLSGLLRASKVLRRERLGNKERK